MRGARASQRRTTAATQCMEGRRTWKADLVRVPKLTLPSTVSAPPNALRILAVPVCERAGRKVSCLRAGEGGACREGTHSIALAVANVGRRAQKVLGRLLDAQDDVDVLALAEDAVAALDGRLDAAVQVELVERTRQVARRLEERAQRLLRGLRRRVGREGGGEERGRGERREVRCENAREERGAGRLGAEDADGVEAERRVEVVVDLLPDEEGGQHGER